MSLSLFPPTVTTPRGGRRRADASPEERAKHIECAKARLWGVPYKQIAAKLGVSQRAVYYWVKAVETYDDPEARALRRLRRQRAADN